MTKRKKSETYEATMGGKKVRVTVPENPDAAKVFADTIRDNFTPEACAAIAAFLDGADTKDEKVNSELGWFAQQLRDLVGGDGAAAKLMDDIGL